jgi:hypothetical protein
MIGPNKYLTIEDSLLGLGARLMALLHVRSGNISDLWKRYKIDSSDSGSFQRFIAALDLLYITSVIEVARDGVTLVVRKST